MGRHSARCGRDYCLRLGWSPDQSQVCNTSARLPHTTQTSNKPALQLWGQKLNPIKLAVTRISILMARPHLVTRSFQADQKLSSWLEASQLTRSFAPGQKLPTWQEATQLLFLIWPRWYGLKGDSKDGMMMTGRGLCVSPQGDGKITARVARKVMFSGTVYP